MTIKIVSDGTPFGTRVYDKETGADLTATLGIQAIEWKLEAKDRLAEATLTLSSVHVEVEGEQS